MPVSPGSRLGPYELISTIGAGGMGEVYRARDGRLNRDVAVKVLPLSFAADQERLRRFTLEAQSAGALNHPNILAIYDIGTHQGLPYIVSELLEGETLRKRLESGKLTVTKAIDYARQIASGLAAAHSRMITHRDIKPDNLFITKDGRVKILDFGLAKSHQVTAGEQTQTAGFATNPGAVMGTAAYMSPEQVRGEPVDHRSDIFSFGCVLYEMLSGQVGFRRDTAVESMNAILKQDPPDLAQMDGTLPPALVRIVRHCLEKSPTERFQSAQDIAFDLESISQSSETGVKAAGRTAPASRSRWISLALASAAAVALLVSGYLIGASRVSPPQLKFHRLTFRRGTIHAARFAPDGRTIVYSAAWENEPARLFTVRTEAPESLVLGFDRAGLFGVSSKGELALALNVQQMSFVYEGTLARAPFSGGAPRAIEEKIHYADWAPDASELALVRTSPQGDLIEYPVGKVLYRGPAAGYISQPRISPAGDRIAFLEHPTVNSDGYVALIDLTGRKRVLTPSYGGDAAGLAWSANGKEVWFTAAKVGARDELRAVSLDGHERLISSQIASMTLQDISRDGAVLLTSLENRRKIFFRGPQDSTERELSWLDWTTLRDISPDGARITFDESGEGVGDSNPFYIRETSGAPAVKLGEGNMAMLSPDGRWVVAVDSSSNGIQILPVGPGRANHLALSGYVVVRAHWARDGKQIFFGGTQPGHGSRIYRISVDGGPAEPITPEGVVLTQAGVTPEGKYIPGLEPSTSETKLFPTAGGPGEVLPGILPRERIANWTADGAAFFSFQQGKDGTFPLSVYRIDRKTGQRQLIKEIAPGDRAGLSAGALRITPDGKSYAYTADQGLSVLQLVEGLK